MEKNTKTAKFTGGPLDGQTKKIESSVALYKHEQPPLSDDIVPGEIPIGFFPPMHEYIYEEKPAGSGDFIYVRQHHQ